MLSLLSHQEGGSVGSQIVLLEKGARMSLQDLRQDLQGAPVVAGEMKSAARIQRNLHCFRESLNESHSQIVVGAINNETVQWSPSGRILDFQTFRVYLENLVHDIGGRAVHNGQVQDSVAGRG